MSFDYMRDPRWSRELTWFLALMVIAGIIYCCLPIPQMLFDPCYGFERFRNGDRDVAVSSMTIHIPRRSPIVLGDPESTSYLTTAFRGASQRDFDLGPVYATTITFTSGRTLECFVYLPGDERSITLGFPHPIQFGFTSDVEHYRISLPHPIPFPLADALSRLH